MYEPSIDGLLAPLRVVDLSDGPGQLTGRVLATLGASVTLLTPPGTDTSTPRHVGLNYGKDVVFAAPDDVTGRTLLARADIVLATGPTGELRRLAPDAVWVEVTPFGRTGPRASWKGSDLTAVAASGHAYATGDPDRAPLRSSQPASYAHGAGEAAFAALTAHAAGYRGVVDVSLQETMATSSLGRAGHPEDWNNGRRTGRFTPDGTQEIWQCRDGWVIFGVRGGPARAATWRALASEIEEAGLASPVWRDRDWDRFNHATSTRAELSEIESGLGKLFASRTLAELDQLAIEKNVMLAPCDGPPGIFAREQFKARGAFAVDGPYRGVAHQFVLRQDSSANAVRHGPDRAASPSGPPWRDVRILELGSGFAAAMPARAFAEFGATVIKVESLKRPDFLRIYSFDPASAAPLERSRVFAPLNAGKLGISLNLKHPRSREVMDRLVDWADVLVENFAPGTLESLGVGPEQLWTKRPDLVILRSCLLGQTGPQRLYPGFGGQGSALSGYNYLTGWPDRWPLGPYGAMTDTLGGRFGAAAVAAALLYRRRTGRGVYLDLSQVEVALFTLAPWLLEHDRMGAAGKREGNRSADAAPHGVFPCAGSDRWVAIAVWNDAEWQRFALLTGIDDDCFQAHAGRQENLDALEDRVAAWTASRDADGIATLLQEHRIEAYPVRDFMSLHSDPQLLAREHFMTLDHTVLGTIVAQRSGFRIEGVRSSFERGGPALGEHNDVVLGAILGLDERERVSLAGDGVLV